MRGEVTCPNFIFLPLPFLAGERERERANIKHVVYQDVKFVPLFFEMMMNLFIRLKEPVPEGSLRVSDYS